MAEWRRSHQTGGHYRPDRDSWTPGPTQGVPARITAGKAVWTVDLTQTRTATG